MNSTPLKHLRNLSLAVALSLLAAGATQSGALADDLYVSDGSSDFGNPGNGNGYGIDGENGFQNADNGQGADDLKTTDDSECGATVEQSRC